MQPGRLSPNMPYKNFKVAVYIPVFDVLEMKDLSWLENTFSHMSRHLHIDKVYLETHRDEITADRDVVLGARHFFEERGVQAAGGITYTLLPTASTAGLFRTYCYTDPGCRSKIAEIARYTASLFDEVILDDFFFTNCKCVACIRVRGGRSWTRFRLDVMQDAARELIVGPAKQANPQVRVIVKYPNWYDHFQNCGFDLEAGPSIFDGIYTGTEARDPVYTHQHLQPYASYTVMRYFDNIAPGRNGGGWVDPFARQFLDRYTEQLSLTLFAKAQEVTLFCYRHLFETLPQTGGVEILGGQAARVAGYAFERADAFLGGLGCPLGIKTYKPYHSRGEDFLPNYLGTLGLPMDITPEFPVAERIILLTEQAGFDEDIVRKIEGQLLAGKDVVITSGLLRVLRGRGVEDLAEIECTGQKALVRRFSDWRAVYPSDYDLLIPQVRYATNDSWELITALDDHYGSGYPILLCAGYAEGKLYVLTIPDNPADLYAYPQAILTAIKKVLLRDFFVYVDSPSHVSLFVYDNDTFIVASFIEHTQTIRLMVDRKFKKLLDLQSGRELEGHQEGEKIVVEASIEPHAYHVFKAG